MKNNSKGTKEWSTESANFISGCKNNCSYCFSRATAIYNKRKTQDNWKEEIVKKDNLINRGGLERAEELCFHHLTI
jgi:DNA repair photolyase